MLPKLPPGADNGGRHADAAIPRSDLTSFVTDDKRLADAAEVAGLRADTPTG
jgi:hypothetical protein